MSWKSQVWLDDQNRNADLELFEDSDHSMFYEEPDRFNELLKAFLAD